MSTLRLTALRTPLVVFAAVLLGIFALTAVPRIFAHEAPVEDQIIHSCVNVKSGEIKIITSGLPGDDDSKDHGSKDDDGCRKKDLLLDWNAKGPQGEPGTNGIDGTNGTNGTDGTDGTNGTDGNDGNDGTDGTNGTNGFSGYEHIRSGPKNTAANNTEVVVYIACPTGKVAVGGGYSVGGSGYTQVRIIDNEPWPRVALPNQWRVNAVRNSNSTSSWTLYANVICVSAP